MPHRPSFKNNIGKAAPLGRSHVQQLTHPMPVHRGNNSYRGGGYNQGYYSRGPSPMIWFDPSDLMWFRSPRTPRHKSNAPMSFLESVFSFVFGDGDPNREYEEKRWQMVETSHLFPHLSPLGKEMFFASLSDIQRAQGRRRGGHIQLLRLQGKVGTFKVTYPCISVCKL